MNESLKMIVVLSVIAMVSAGILAQVYQTTSAIIEENQAQAMESSVYDVLPGITSVARLDTAPEGFLQDDPEQMREAGPTTMIFIGLDEQENPVGYAFIGEANGYGGAVRVLVGVGEDSGEITGIKVLDHAETPGLGTRIEEESFRSQFVGKTLDDPIAINQDIDNLSGATVSARAATEAVRSGFEDAAAIYGRGN